MAVRAQQLGHLHDQHLEFDGLRIRLEGSLEVVESLTSRWVAAREELNAHALPRTSTLTALRVHEVEASEAVEHCRRVDDAASQVRRLEKAQAEWVKEVQKGLTRLGIPEGSTNPRQLVEQVENLGEVEVLDVWVRKSPRPDSTWALYLVAFSCLNVLEPYVPRLVIGFGVPLLMLGFMRALWRARKARAHAVLSHTSLFARNHEPLDLATIELVSWGTWGNELRFTLKDGRAATWTIAGKAAALLDRLHQRRIQLSPPRG